MALSQMLGRALEYCYHRDRRLITLVITVMLSFLIFKTIPRAQKKKQSPVPVSVNYFPSRLCNKTCGFCFHVDKTSYILPEEEAKRGLKRLVEAGMKKLNIAGGEPFLYPEFIGHLCQYVKEDLHLESVSLVTNGSKVTERWLRKYGKFVDIIAVSCDSFNEQTNIEIGRGTGDNVQQLRRIKTWCQQYGIKFKMNTVVCSLNWQEDLSALIQELAPFRWKVFQVLLVGGENDEKSTTTGRGKLFDKFHITDEQFESFCRRHKHVGDLFIPEPNNVMAKSYLLLDEYMRFLDKGNGVEKTSESILDVPVEKALSQVEWDVESFEKRGGIYDWKRKLPEPGSGGNCGTTKPELDW
ncbi:hypothetical protein AJ80_09239 [Polytolypa hystricis UAMH7299]|uniref:Radical SAM core domain-containing protein n=1 Tax=Polytolypa hystricis (strain UAMH7299) TaxID=1447883 RepID=A0A2B7WU47_POLH7|nr:hypothetical protein AJ80_09239 [Polytolypa hystricis UAMH7299]